MIIVYSAYSSELFRECCQATTLLLLASAPLTLLSCFSSPTLYCDCGTLHFCSAYSSELFPNNSSLSTIQSSSAPLTLLSCFGRTAHFFKVQLAKKTQLLLMHSYYMAYSCINCQILLHRIILTCSFSSANPTAILWVLNVRAPW